MRLLRFFILITIILVYDSFTISAQVTPNSITGLKLWLTGDSIHKSTTTDIDICYDLSGLNNHATQTTFSSQPQDAGITLNGHKTMRFDGLDDYLNFNVIADIRTVFWVIKENPLAGTNCQFLLGHSAPPYTHYDFHRGYDGSGNATKEMWSAVNTNASIKGGITSVNSNTVNGTTFIVPTNFSLISLVTTGNVEADNFSSDRFITSPAPRYWDGDLAELIIYNQALTPTQVAQIEQYLYDKYTKPVNLGPDQITCNFPITLKAKKDFILNYTWQDNSTDDSLVVNSPGTYYVTTTDVFGKTSSDTINVIQGPLTYSVVLGNDTTICSGQQITLDAGPDYLTYLWSNGATSHSITVNSQATYSVNVTDCSGNVTVDSIKVTVQALPTFNLGADRPICYNVGYILDPGFTNTLSLNFNWSNNTHNSTLPITSSGTYSLEVIDNLGCTFSDAVNLQIDSSLSNLSLGPNISFCAGNSITLTSGMNPSLTYTWSNGSHNDSLIINTTGQYSVVVTNTNNCVNSDTIDITVFGQAPNANFSASIGCLNNAVSFTNLSSPPLGNSITASDWNFGDPSSGTNTSTLTNPAHTYTAIGVYTVTLKVTTDATCEQTIIQTVSISPSPTVNFSVGIPCQNNNTAFTNQSTSSGGYSITSLSWNFGDPISGSANTSSSSSPSHVFNNQTTYSVSLVAINNGGCKDSLTKTVTVIPCNITPNDISGLKLWFTGDSIHRANSTDIDTCYDLSGSNNDGLQLLSINQPKYNGIMLNGHKTMSFDGADDYLQFNAISDIRTVFWVIKEESVAATNGQVLLGHSPPSNIYDFHRGTNSSFAPSKQLWSAANTNPAVLNGITSVNSATVNGSTFNVPTHFSLISLVTSGNVAADNFSNDRNLTGRYWDGNLAELIIYNQALTPTQVIQVEQYLHQKYTKPVDLGPDKMTCAFPITLKAKKDYFLNYLWQNASTADSLVVNGPGTYYLTTTDVFNKVTSDTIVISLSPATYTATLGNDTTICSGQQLILNAGPDNLNYVWSTNSISHLISINTGGTYSVSVTDCSGNITTDMINVTIQTPPAFNFGSKDTIICANSAFVLDPGFGTSSPFTFNWQDNSNASSYPILANGQYYLDVTDNIGCKSSDTINVQIDNSLNLLSLGPDKQLCAGNLITLTQGMSPSLTYTWNTGSNNDSLLITNTGQYSVIVTNTNNCVAQDTIDITIQGFAPTANFSSSIGCVNQIVSFTDLSIPPSGNSISNYEWSFGDNASPTNTSTTSNPSHTYTNTGTYTVNLTVTTNSNCEQSIIKTINIYPVPTATFAIGIACQNDSTAFMNQSTSAIGYPIVSSYWNFGDVTNNTSTLTSPKHVYGINTNYTVKLLVTNNVGCKDSVYKSFTVQDEVKADFTVNSACTNTATVFQSTSIAPSGAEYLYSFGNSTATTPMAQKTYTNSGVYSVTLYVDGKNQCTSTITKLINVYLPPIADFSITSFCSKDTINIINTTNPQSGVLATNKWFLNTTLFSSAQNPTLSLTTPSNYTVKLDVTNSFGCKDAVTKSVTVFPNPVVDFSTSPTAFYYVNEPVNFIPSITNASSYLWNINSTPTFSIQSPTETFNIEGSYNMSLNLKDQNGCKGSKTKIITLSKRYLDLAILNITTQKDNDGFMTVIADLANYGSVPINTFDMHYQISDAGNIKETWNGSLNPNSFYQYTFNSRSASTLNSNNNITCVEIEKVNSITDENITNNFLCNSLNTNNIDVANPFPNPTDGDIILPITLNRDLDYTIAIYNSIGQIQYEETTKKGVEGLNFVTLNTSSYARGCYIIKIMIDEEIIIKKIIKTSFE